MPNPIRSPRRGSRHPDRGIECQEAIEEQFQAIADEAYAAGWTEDEAACALLGLAVAHLKARQSAAEVRRIIKSARASVGEH